ncbi:NAD(P)-binding protein [Astrocystis sublimbata]|nr:NAD(P)-binding protein [Astrocystis sublimbata]
MSSDKIITLITGANSGLGFQVAKNLVSYSASYHVIIGSRDIAKGESAVQALSKDLNLKGTISTVQLDVTDDASVDAAAEYVKQEHGRLDLLINNAGIFMRGEPRQVARSIFATNVVGYISVTEAFLPLMCLAPAPRIVFLSSSLGSLTNASDPSSPYYSPLGAEYRAATAARNMLMNQYWVRLQQSHPGKFKVHGADPGLNATDLADTPDQLRKRGAVEPNVGGERVASVARGDRDSDVGRVCGVYGVSPW